MAQTHEQEEEARRFLGHVFDEPSDQAAAIVADLAEHPEHYRVYATLSDDKSRQHAGPIDFIKALVAACARRRKERHQ